MNQIRLVKNSSIDQICGQWNSVASVRDEQIRSGLDVSYEFVLKPTILELIKDANRSLVLDAGCGSGAFTEVLAISSQSVIGVDMSSVSISIANSSNTRPKNVHYFGDTVESYLSKNDHSFTLVVANMVLQDTANLEDCLEAIASKSCKNATLVATITHPWFWPTYWGYDKKSWFKYSDILEIEAPFKISSDPTPLGITTHFHRPLSYYIEKLAAAGFRIDKILEPMPPLEILEQNFSIWKFPRFLAFKCTYNP